MYTTKRKRFAPTAPAKEILIDSCYWLVKKAPTLGGERLIWWVRPVTMGCGASPRWMTTGYTIAERDQALTNVSRETMTRFYQPSEYDPT
jgi:hypothetical protein